MAEVPKSIKATLYIDGKPAESSLKNIESVTQRLNRELKNLEVGTDAWNRKMKELQQHRKVLADINSEIKETNGLFGFLKTEIGKMGALAAGYLGFQFVTDQFRDIIMGNAQLSDSFADVRKTTGMSEEAVRRLAAEFKKLDTRTSQADLLNLAQVAGKLGIAGERDVLGFVRAADKIGVALGKDLGNTEEAVNSLGKLTELFKIKDEYGLEEALIRTGSAINSLGAAGTASEAYLVEFTKRMGGIAPQANFSIQSILGLAATMDELGQPVEASATAIGQFVVGMGKDIPGFARIAGMSVKDFSAILKTDGNQALLEVLKNLKSTGLGVSGLAEKMGMVGEDGARAVASLGALSNNLDLLVTRQKLANDEFARGTSLQEEFDIKNATFGSTLQKTAKDLRALTANTVLTDFLKNVVYGFSQLITWGHKNMVMIVNLTKLLLVGVTAWSAYKVALLVVSTATEVYAARIAFARTASLAFAGVQALLTGNMVRAQAAMRALNITMAANPIGAVVAVLATLITAVALFSKTTTAAEKTQEAFNNIEAEAQKKRNDEIQKIKEIQKALTAENLSRNQKLTLVNKLRQIMPDALKHLKDEEVLTNKGTVAINKYVKALEARTLAEAAQDQIRKLQERNIEIENGATNETSLWQDTKAFVRSGNIDQYRKHQKEYGRQNALHEKEENARRIKAIQEKYGAGMVSNMLTSDDVTTGGTSTGGLTTESTGTKAKRLFNEAEQERIASLARTEQAIMDSYAREVSEVDEHYRKLKEKHKTNAATVEQLEKERVAKIAEINRKFRTDDLQKLQSIYQELHQINAANIQKDTDRQLAELKNATDQKLRQMATEENLIQEKIDQQQKTVNKLLSAGKKDEAKVLQDAIARELQMLDASGKLRLAFLKQQEIKEAEIRAAAKADADLSALEAAVIDATELNPDYDKSIAGQIALLNYKHDLEVAQAERTGRDVAAINAKYLADRQKLERDFTLQRNDFLLNSAQSVADTIFSISADSRRAESDAAISKLERQREDELSNKSLTESQKKAIQDKYDKKIREEKEKAWKAEQRAAIVQALINGALAITKVIAQTGILSPFAIPAIAVATAAQVAAIASQKMPKFAQGGMSDEDPAGYVSQPTLFNRSASGRRFIAGEAGREWIAPNWMLKSPRYANIIGMLETARQEKRAFAAGGSTADPVHAPAPQQDNSELIGLMKELILTQKQASDKKVLFVYKDFEEYQGRVTEIRHSSAA